MVARHRHVQADREEEAVTEPPVNIHIHSTLSRRQRAQLRKALYKEEPAVSVVPVKSAPAKPGYRTTEFWLAIATAVGTAATSAEGSLPPRYAAIASTVAFVAYALSRGLAKH